MSPADWIVLGILAALVIAVVVIMVRRRKRGGCCGGCSGCAERGCCHTKRDSGEQ
ncbi:MAG: FeoB-associated Cys-rich membrane protein [Clostridiales bacterium]|nr:FeoB-associated Cys-rich membrane protein [Clostridiales bacterium]